MTKAASRQGGCFLFAEGTFQTQISKRNVNMLLGLNFKMMQENELELSWLLILIIMMYCAYRQDNLLNLFAFSIFIYLESATHHKGNRLFQSNLDNLLR